MLWCLIRNWGNQNRTMANQLSIEHIIFLLCLFPLRRQGTAQPILILALIPFFLPLQWKAYVKMSNIMIFLQILPLQFKTHVRIPSAATCVWLGMRWSQYVNVLIDSSCLRMVSHVQVIYVLTDPSKDC